MPADRVPRYPRIPHLPGSRATADDVVLERMPAWVEGDDVVVEEKLDGANASIWVDASGEPRVSGRAGPGAADRAGQFGRMRAWAAHRRQALLAALAPGDVLYGEWLFLRHTLRYDRLPDLFVPFDVYCPERGYLDRSARCLRFELAALVPVPLLRRGGIRSVAELDALCARSRFGDCRMEGLVVRREVGGCVVQRAKWIRPDFRPRPDADWGTGERNAVAPSPQEQATSDP